MSRALAALTAILACIDFAAAADNAECGVASHLAHADYALPRLAAAIRQAGRLDIVVAGTGSSTLAGPDGAAFAYPARLQAALVKRLAGRDIRVTAVVKARQTAADMAKDFDQILAGTKPNLLIWQAGTVDAMKGVDPDAFRASLDHGIEKLHAGGADLVLMNMQYSPRTESMIAIGTYADSMRVVSQHREVPLFDRLSIMKHWSETGTFDLYGATRALQTASRVHDCIGQLLADLIVEAVELSEHHKLKP